MTDKPVSRCPSFVEPLLELFPVVMLLDRELRVVFASDTLNAYVPGLERQPLLSEAFKLVRPRSVMDYEEAISYLRSLFLLTSAGDEFAVRGQLLQQSCDGRDYLAFCGAPWLSWMVANQPGVRLGLKDFSPQDVQLDQLFYMSTEARMVADLEGLNSELKEAKDEVESAQAAKDRFFAQMSHEMRTPLNGVVSALALMRDEGPGGKVGELLELASKSSSNLMQVINYVLDVSKLQSTEAAPEEEDFDLSELVGSVNDVVRARALEKGLDLRSHCDPALPGRCIGDPNRLRQALLNLVINAIKYTDAGAVTIGAELSRDESEGVGVRFEVQDSGVGIARDKQAKIFEAFTTLSRHQDPGTGLGLDIARRNVESMGGKIGVSSAPGVGSTFWIELPLRPVDVDALPNGPSHAQEESGEPPVFKGHVLLVDDNETNLMLGAMILEGMGVTVSQATSGEMAVQMAIEGDFNLVLMDISMPGIDGCEATRLIRQRLAAEMLPIVALTAYASSSERSRSESAGMNGYLTKPIERDSLEAVLVTWLDAEQSVDAVAADGQAGAEARRYLDIEVLESLAQQIGPANLESVIMKFSDEAGRRWRALEHAGDPAGRSREAHTLASTCRSFGLPAIADRLNAIEAQARGDEAVEAPGLEVTGRELSAGLLELNAAVASLCGRPS